MQIANSANRAQNVKTVRQRFHFPFKMLRFTEDWCPPSEIKIGYFVNCRHFCIVCFQSMGSGIAFSCYDGWNGPLSLLLTSEVICGPLNFQSASRKFAGRICTEHDTRTHAYVVWHPKERFNFRYSARCLRSIHPTIHPSIDGTNRRTHTSKLKLVSIIQYIPITTHNAQPHTRVHGDEWARWWFEAKNVRIICFVSNFSAFASALDSLLQFSCLSAVDADEGSRDYILFSAKFDVLHQSESPSLILRWILCLRSLAAVCPARFCEKNKLKM